MAFPNMNFKEVFTSYNKDAKYIIHCETCLKVFFESTLQEVETLIDFNEKTGQWNHQTWTPAKQKWYIVAARHWVETDLEHKVVLTITQKIGNTIQSHLGYDFSKEWHQGLLLEPTSNRNTKAMLDTLDDLEKNVA